MKSVKDIDLSGFWKKVMGLFGYNKWIFEKNNQKFKKRLENILESIVSNEYTQNSIFVSSIGRALNCILLMIDRLPYVKSGKEYAIVDSEIDRRISAMEEDVKERRFASLIFRCIFLIKEFDEGRRFGIRAFSPKELEVEYVRAEALGNIHGHLIRIEAIEARQHKIVALAAQASEEKIRRYELEYNNLETKKIEVRREISVCKNTYDSLANIISGSKEFFPLDEISQHMGDLASFERELERSFGKIMQTWLYDEEPVPPLVSIDSLDFGQIEWGIDRSMSGFDKLVAEKFGTDIHKSDEENETCEAQAENSFRLALEKMIKDQNN